MNIKSKKSIPGVPSQNIQEKPIDHNLLDEVQNADIQSLLTRHILSTEFWGTQRTKKRSCGAKYWSQNGENSILETRFLTCLFTKRACLHTPQEVWASLIKSFPAAFASYTIYKLVFSKTKHKWTQVEHSSRSRSGLKRGPSLGVVIRQ